MDIKKISKAIDLNNGQFALALIRPKRLLLDWISQTAHECGIGNYNLYIPQEDTVLIIPPIEIFENPGDLNRLLVAVKPMLLKAELLRFAKVGEKFQHPISADSFDMFYEIEIRDNIVSLSGLSS